MKEITAPEGQVYTQVEEVPLTDRIFASTLCLPTDEAEEEWKLITQDEEAEYTTAQEAAFQALLAETDPDLRPIPDDVFPDDAAAAADDAAAAADDAALDEGFAVAE